MVTLTEKERENLKELVQKGKVSGQKIRHAQVSLKLDAIPVCARKVKHKFANILSKIQLAEVDQQKA